MSTRQKANATPSLDDRQIEDIANKVFANFMAKFEKNLDGKFKIIEEKLDKFTSRMNVLQDSLHDNICSVKAIDKRVESVEGNCKRNTLRLDGVKENDQEDLLHVVLTLISNKLKINCKDTDINDVYRMGQPKQKGNNPRTIILKFVSFITRNKVYNSKKNLKGTGIFINEDLSKVQYELLKAAKKKYGSKQVWTIGGRIFGIVNDEIQNISSI